MTGLALSYENNVTTLHRLKIYIKKPMNIFVSGIFKFLECDGLHRSNKYYLDLDCLADLIPSSSET